jgi:hypothetical protein
MLASGGLENSFPSWKLKTMIIIAIFIEVRNVKDHCINESLVTGLRAKPTIMNRSTENRDSDVKSP